MDRICIPKYLTHFYRKGQQPFQNICDLGRSAAEEILKNDTQYRGDGTYMTERIKHEALLRSKFIAVGGKPKRMHPIYMILGDSPSGPHDLNSEYEEKIKLPLEIFSSKIVSFTYPDSMYMVPLNELGRLYLDRNPEPRLYRIEELGEVIRSYEIYRYNNHYIEAQVWDDTPIRAYCGDI